MFIKKKTLTLIIIYFTAAVIAVSAYFITNNLTARSYRTTAVYGYSHAFNEVVTASENLSRALHRAEYATGSEMSAAVCADIYGNCLAAEMTMSALPFSTQELEQTAGFIGVAGDYARSLMRSSAANGFDDTTRNNFAKLYKISQSITEKLDDLQAKINDGEVLMDEPENVFADTDGEYMSKTMLKLESEIGELPELDYDGQYTKAKDAVCEDPVSKAEAKKAAAGFIGADADELKLEYGSESGTRCYSYKDSLITVNGQGQISSVSSGRSVTGEADSGELEKAARDFLAKQGMTDMELVSSELDGGVQRMCFECRHGNACCEDDCVVVSIAADTKELYSYDARQHLKNHDNERNCTPAVDEQTALQALPTGISVSDSRLRFAETDGGRERLCYEFDCTAENGDNLNIFVDAQTGRQYRIECK